MLEEGKKRNWFMIVIGLCTVVVIVVAFYNFFFQKNYDFIVEIACDPITEVCLERDCANPEDCPPNQLTLFKRYALNADDFKLCENEDCTNVCMSGIIECELLECVEDPDYGETCTNLETYEPRSLQSEDSTEEIATDGELEARDE